MLLVKPSFEVLTNLDGAEILRSIEEAGRTCYKSEGKITPDSLRGFIRKILVREHESVIEHESASVRFIIDRGVSHELVRHRLASYSQESTRYCNYAGGVTFVIPPWCDLEPRKEYLRPTGDEPRTNTHVWLLAMFESGARYQNLLANGWTPQQARSVLPNSLKTEIVMTANLREWRHVLKLRTSSAAHPQMREVMIPLLEKFRSEIPVVFDSL